MSVDKPEAHDVWNHDGDTMRKFNINDQVVPVGDPLTSEWASWGPRTMHDGEEELFDACEVFVVTNSVSKKIFGSTYWFHEIGGYLPADHEMVSEDADPDGDYVFAGHFGHFNAADLRAPTQIEEKDLR